MANKFETPDEYGRIDKRFGVCGCGDPEHVKCTEQCDSSKCGCDAWDIE